MNLGSLEFQLMADLAQLKKDMDDAKSSVSGAMGGIESAVNVAKAAFLALGGAAAIIGFAGMINGAIEGAAALKDMSIATGASVESLSKFNEVGRTTNTNGDAITGMMNKLSKAAMDAGDGTKGAGVALNALGINFETFRQMSPDDKLNTVATAMNGFRDGSEKSAVAMELLGKQGALALPFLKDLATTGDVVARVTTEQATAADNFSDNLTVLKASSEAWKTELAMGMVPALDSAATAFLDVMNESGGLREEIRKLSADGTIATWTTNTITGVTYVMDAFSGFGRVVVSVGEVIGAWAAMVTQGFTATFDAVGQAVRGNFGGAMDTMKAMLTNQKDTVGDLGAKLSDTWSEQTLGQKLRARMGEMKDMGDVSEASKPKLDVTAITNANEAARKSDAAATKAQEAATKAHTAELKKQEDQYEKLKGSINAKAAAMEAEMAQGKALTEAQKAEVKLLADLDAGTIKLTDEQRKNTLAAIANQAAVEAKYTAYKEDKKQTEENTKENATYLAGLYKSTDALISDTEKMRDSISQMGLSREELALLSITKDLDRAATLERQAQVIISTQGETAQSTAFKDQAAALRELAGLKEQGIHVKAAIEARNAWEATTRAIGTGLSGELINAVASGKDIWLSFRDYMVKTVIDGQIKSALASVITDGLNSLISGITGLKIGGGGASGSGSSLLGSALNAGADKLTGGTGGVTGAIGSAGNAIGSALGLTGGSAAAGASMLGSTAGSAAAINGGIASGTAAFEAALAGSGAAAGGTAAAGGAAAGSSAAGTSAMGGFGAVAGPVAAMLAVFAVMNSMNDKDGLNVWNTYDASGKGGSGPLDGTIAQRNRFAMNRPTMDAMADSYVSTARALKMTPEAGAFGFDSASDGTFNMGATFDGGHYRSGWVPNSADTMEWARARALFTALQASEKPKSIAGFFDGVDAGLLPLADIQERLAQAAAAPKFALGGDHLGGLRIVGERGPELEATGPARIFNSQQTASILNGGNNSEQVAVLKATVANQQAQIAQNAAAYRLMVDKLDQIARSVSDSAKSQRMQVAAA